MAKTTKLKNAEFFPKPHVQVLVNVKKITINGQEVLVKVFKDTQIKKREVTVK